MNEGRKEGIYNGSFLSEESTAGEGSNIDSDGGKELKLHLVVLSLIRDPGQLLVPCS